MTPDNLCPGAPRPPPAQGLEAAGAHGEGLLHPPPANP